MKIKATLLGALLLISSSLGAREHREVFTSAFNAIPDKAATFKPGAAWFPFPAYSDRAGWDKLIGDRKNELIKKGDAALKHVWQITPTSEFLAFEKDGDRKHLDITRKNRNSLNMLIFAELADGKGKYIPQIINGLYCAAEADTWQYAVHTARQKSHRFVPDPNDRYISLGAASVASTIAIAWYFFHEEFDKYDPSISKTIHDAIRKNIIDPYMDSSKDRAGHSWMGFNEKLKVNNWNTYCNTFCAHVFLLTEQDPERLIAEMEKVCRSVDCYMDYVKLDGACEEGPSYWNMAGAKVYDFARLMYLATGGQMNLLKNQQVINMCLWKSKIDFGEGWVVNYGDGGARNSGGGRLLYRMGVDLDNQEMKDFGIATLTNVKEQTFESKSSEETLRHLEDFLFEEQLRKDEEAALEAAGGDWQKMLSMLRSNASSSFYPETETAILRNRNNWVLAPKGGHNGESHNHNDVGSAILFVDSCPVFVDPGVATYGKDTFSSKRYTLWYMNSNGHNTVTINGELEKDGKEFAAKNTTCDINANTFSTDIAGAFPEEAACKSWVRNFKLDDKGLTITDSYELSERKAADNIHFMSLGKVSLGKKGEFTVEAPSYDRSRMVKVKVKYPKTLKASVEVQKVTDAKQKKVWGDTLYRITLESASDAPLKGSYTISVTPSK